MDKNKDVLSKLNVLEKIEKKLIKAKRICCYPRCREKAKNSHILQKKGILSVFMKDNHLWQINRKNFRKGLFEPQKVGINKIFSFKCFCNEHDNKLFSKIENVDIDFSDYQARLLFLVRNVYYELYKKELAISKFEAVKDTTNNLKKKEIYKLLIEEEQKGIKDLNVTKQAMWKDIDTGNKSFVIEVRFMIK